MENHQNRHHLRYCKRLFLRFSRVVLESFTVEKNECLIFEKTLQKRNLGLFSLTQNNYKAPQKAKPGP